MTEKIVVDNGSIASKLLQHELKDAKVVKVTGKDLLQNFTHFDPKKTDQRIYLPFTSDQLAANNEQIRNEIAKVEGVGFRNQVVLPYEGNDSKTIEYRAKDAGIVNKVEDNKPYTSVPEPNRKAV